MSHNNSDTEKVHKADAWPPWVSGGQSGFSFAEAPPAPREESADRGTGTTPGSQEHTPAAADGGRPAVRCEHHSSRRQRKKAEPTGREDCLQS